jgi:hypothetical protein
LENTSTDNANNLDSDVIKAEIGSSGSSERKDKKRIFFLTRSLAEVYVKQNHLASALEIYRRMLAKNLDDQNLKERIMELENCIAAKRGIKSKEPNT